MEPLREVRVVSLACNIPGPVAASRLGQWGARITKIEPLDGDPLFRASPVWYAQLTRSQHIVRLDLKTPPSYEQLLALLADSDVLLTANRPAALRRLGLDWIDLHRRLPRLCQVAIVGDSGPDADRPGHDLTHQARAGLIDPPHLPRSLVADLAGAERAVSAALAALLARVHDGQGSFTQVALATAAETFAAPRVHGLTAPGGLLGGGLPGYNLYQAKSGWIAVAALETHFWERLIRELGITDGTRAELKTAFAARTAAAWEAWAAARDLPLTAVSIPDPAAPGG